MDFRKILVAVLVVACVPHPGDAAVPTCPDDGTEVCYNCVTRGDCSAGGGNDAGVGTECDPGEACKVVTGVATCMPLSTVPDCNCGGANAGCDAYNTDVKIFCAPPGAGRSVYISDDCAASNPSNTCVDGQCVAATSSSCIGLTIVSFILSTPTCTSGIFCNQEVEVFTDECEAGEYFNLAKSACEAYPPNPCDGCTGPKCPIITDCSKYAVCSNGVAADGDESCADGEFFDPTTQACGATATGACTDYEDCVFESTTTVPSSTASESDDTSTDGDTPTATPTTSAPTTTTTKAPCTSTNANQRYPHETDCKKYYTCREVTRNSFRYTESTCPTPYVFNPTILKCDLVSKVPACQTSAT